LGADEPGANTNYAAEKRGAMQIDAQIRQTTAAPLRNDRRRRPRQEGGTKPVDLTYLARFTLGNRDLEREVLDLFITHVPRYLTALQDAVTAKAWHDAAHTLKGSARGIGAWRVSRCAEAAERLRFDTDLDRRAFALDSAAEAVAEAIGYLEVHKRGS
jgi:HPt (histidine-containing phosphotransfer) domain-containing protein